MSRRAAEGVTELPASPCWFVAPPPAAGAGAEAGIGWEKTSEDTRLMSGTPPLSVGCATASPSVDERLVAAAPLAAVTGAAASAAAAFAAFAAALGVCASVAAPPVRPAAICIWASRPIDPAGAAAVSGANCAQREGTTRVRDCRQK